MSDAATLMTVDQFLEMERASDVKHEYFNGEVVEMPGGTRRHARIIRNFLNCLSAKLVENGDQLEALPSDMKVKTPSGLYTYPDLSVSTNSANLEGEDDLSVEPVALVEVLSPSTEAYDRGEKFRRYETIPTLRLYVLVSQNRAQIELFERSSANDRWQLSRIEGVDAECSLGPLDVSIRIGEIYRGVDFESN